MNCRAPHVFFFLLSEYMIRTMVDEPAVWKSLEQKYQVEVMDIKDRVCEIQPCKSRLTTMFSIFTSNNYGVQMHGGRECARKNTLKLGRCFRNGTCAEWPNTSRCG